MRINKLILENFAAIKNAMQSNRIELDLSKTTNKICLLIGKNGSGKTTLLSMLQPFADMGNLDVRNGNSMILEDKDGYKEIHIEDNGDNYIIKHFYTHHKGKSHSIKSYISKNGVELNENGNVSSFKEYVKIELDIEPEYLKLIRLGDNVTSLIDMSTTERKNYMGKIMDDIGIYLEYYKAVNLKLRQLSELISHTVDKLNRLNVVSESDIEKDIESLRLEISSTEETLQSISGNIAVYKHELSTIEDIDDLNGNLKTYKKKYQKMIDILDKKDSLESKDPEFYKEKLNDLVSMNVRLQSENDALSILVTKLLTDIDDATNKIHNLSIEADKNESIEKELSRMTDSTNSLRLSIRDMEDILGDFKPCCSLTEIESFRLFLLSSDQLLRQTYEFGKEPLKKVVELMRENRNVSTYAQSHLLELSDDYSDSKSIELIYKKVVSNKDDSVVNNCTNTCIAKEIFNQLINLAEINYDDVSKNDPEFYRYMDLIYKNLMNIIPQFGMYTSLIEKLPDDVKEEYKLSNIYSHIEKMGSISSIKKLDDYISLVTEYENYLSALKDLKDSEENLDRFKTFSNIKDVRGELEELNTKLSEMQDDLVIKRNTIKDNSEIIGENNKSIEVYTDIIDTLISFDEVEKLYHKYNDDSIKVSNINENLRNSDIEYEKVSLVLDSLNKRLQDTSSTLTEYRTYNKDLQKYNSVYDDMTYIKEALSAKEGIPLHFITRYLGNVEEITNELLSIAYNGKIYIDSFDISPTEFSIPFVNNGVRLSDVKYASQGELSLLKVALSFALSSQTISKYNIMLWDEPDGPLDTENREKFIPLIENQIERVNSEQSFLITHNNMFSSYPIDIIDLTFENDIDKYPYAHYVPISRK